MEQELQQQGQEQKSAYKEKESIQVGDPATALIDSGKALAKFGGFSFIEKSVKGTQNLNPENKARKKIFLTDATKKGERIALKNALQIWSESLSASDNLSEVVNNAQEKANSASQTIKKNLRKALAETKELESSWRSLQLFYKNTEKERVKNITIMNADLEQVSNLDDDSFYAAIADELSNVYDRFDLRKSYSIVTIPGYLGSNQVIEKWAKLALKNQVTLVTDFGNEKSADDVLSYFEGDNLTSGDVYKKNVIMACNWLVGRGKDQTVDEDEDVYVSPAAALAGNIYKGNLSQVSAGKKYGTLAEVSGVRLNLKKSEVTQMEKMGLVPMVDEFGKVMAMSAKTLFNGDNIGHQTYSVVRVFDYISKVLKHFLNQRAFENFDSETRAELRSQIVKFLDGVAGPGKLIEKFEILRFDRDPNQKDRVFLDIHMTPYFPGKTYVIGLDGQRGDGPNPKWSTDIAQK
jgi:Type VI secretion system, TssC, VipB